MHTNKYHDSAGRDRQQKWESIIRRTNAQPNYPQTNSSLQNKSLFKMLCALSAISGSIVCRIRKSCVCCIKCRSTETNRSELNLHCTKQETTDFPVQDTSLQYDPFVSILSEPYCWHNRLGGDARQGYQLHSTLFFCAALYSIIRYCPALYNTPLYSSMLHYSLLPLQKRAHINQFYTLIYYHLCHSVYLLHRGSPNTS